MVRRTKAEAQETRQLILDAAERVFQEQGVARTSLQDVAAAAGVTRGAIYWHFKDKVELFSAMMDRVVLPCESAVNSERDAGGRSGRQALVGMALAPLELLVTNAQLRRVFHIAMHRTEYTQDMATISQRHVDSVAEFREELAAVVRLGQADGSLRATVDPAAAALGLFALIDGLMHHWTLTPEGFDLASVGRHAVEAYVAGLS